MSLSVCVHIYQHIYVRACAELCLNVCACVRVCVFVSECVFLCVSSVWPGHRMLQGHVLCSSERQSVCAVVVDQLRDIGENAAALIQRVAQALTALSLGHNDVHAALAGPSGTRQRERCILKCVFIISFLRRDSPAHRWHNRRRWKKMEILSLSKRGCAFSEFSGCLNGVNDVDSQMNEQRTTNVHWGTWAHAHTHSHTQWHHRISVFILENLFLARLLEASTLQMTHILMH